MQSQKFESDFNPETNQRSTRLSVLRQLLAASMMTLGAIGAEAVLLSVQASSLTNWNFDPAANQLEITVKDGTTPRYFLMAQPARIVVDLPNTALGDVSAQKSYSGAVRQIRVSQFEPGLTRIVMEISPGVSLAPGQVKLQKVGKEASPAGNARWLLQPLITQPLSANAAAVKPLIPVQPSARATVPSESVAKPPKPPQATIAPTAKVAAVAKTPIAQPQSLETASTIPSTLAGRNRKSPAVANPATVDNDKPTVVVPDLAASPTTAVTSAPVLPSSPTPAAQTETQTVPPLPPVTVLPFQPRASATVPSESAMKPLTVPSTTITPKGEAVDRAKIPIVPSQPIGTARAIPSPSVGSNPLPAALANSAKTGRNDAKPSVVVPNITAAPATSLALAPVLPSLPTPTAQAETQTVMPLPSVTSSPVDLTVVGTQSGIAIAVPPITPAANTRPSSDNLSSKPSVAAPTPPVVPRARSVAEPPQALVPSTSSTPVVKTTPATVASRSTPQPTTTQVPAVLSLSLLDIPTTLAANGGTPTVSVPPLTASGVPPLNAAPAQPRQPDIVLEAPPSGVLVSVNAPPSVSVPPLIRVGTPSLGLPTIAAPVVESALPSSVFSPNATLAPPVEVPLQQAPVPAIVQPEAAQTSYDANTVRQSASSANLAPPLDSAALSAPLQLSAPTVSTTPGYDATTIRQPPTSPAPASIVEFGQPLLTPSRTTGVSQPLSSLPNASAGVRQAFKPAAPNVLLPAGTTLNLRYPGNSTLTLRSDSPQQELLVLLTELRDVSGNLLAPAGSTITGRFETTASGSQFVTQAIVVAGRTVPLAAQSEALDGSRRVEGNNLARNSGIGVLAGGVLGALGGSVGLGALGGAAAGAATTLLTAPKPAIIQPGQIVQVRLTQDLRSAE